MFSNKRFEARYAVTHKMLLDYQANEVIRKCIANQLLDINSQINDIINTIGEVMKMKDAEDLSGYVDILFVSLEAYQQQAIYREKSILRLEALPNWRKPM